MVSSAIDELHRNLFGFVPAKAGTAYERLTAIVLATLGWSEIRHDVIERPSGRYAQHQLDVTARTAEGQSARLIIECKDWNKTVGQETVNALVGVQNQIGDCAAAIITTEGFTEGARNVASDENISMIVMHPYDPVRDPGPYVTTISVTVDVLSSVHSDFDIEVAVPADFEADEEIRFSFTNRDHLVLADGSIAEEVDLILRRNVAPLKRGTYRQRAELLPGRFLPTIDDRMVEIAALLWTENVLGTEFTSTTEAQGTPVLALDQIDRAGEAIEGRLVISEDLFVWDIATDGGVVPRGIAGAASAVHRSSVPPEDRPGMASS